MKTSNLRNEKLSSKHFVGSIKCEMKFLRALEAKESLKARTFPLDSQLNIFVYFSNRRPLQPYQVKEPVNNRPKPLSDEFSNEFTENGENFNNNGIRWEKIILGLLKPSIQTDIPLNSPQQSANIPNRFGAQQNNDFGFGGAGFPGGHGGGFPGGFPGQYPGQFGIGHGGGKTF